MDIFHYACVLDATWLLNAAQKRYLGDWGRQEVHQRPQRQIWKHYVGKGARVCVPNGVQYESIPAPRI